MWREDEIWETEVPKFRVESITSSLNSELQMLGQHFQPSLSISLKSIAYSGFSQGEALTLG